MKKILGVLLLMGSISCVWAQVDHKIKIIIPETQEKTLYLRGFCGDWSSRMDSANVKGNGTFVFKGKKALPSGIYYVEDKDRVVYFSVIIDKERQFSITMQEIGTQYRFTCDGSMDNAQNLVYQLRKMYDTCSSTIDQEYIEMSPCSFFSKYLKAKQREKMVSSLFTGELSTEQSGSVQDRYFDNIDFTDSRLLHSPLHVGIAYYFNQMLPQNVDTIRSRVDWFIQKTASNQEVKHYYLNALYFLFNNDTPIGDAMLVHLYDKYGENGQCPWLEPIRAKMYKKIVERKRRILPGASVPAIYAYDNHGQLLKTSDIKSDYIVLWFWDPDCDDCVEQTPKLFERYKALKEKYNIDVFAVSISEDVERWHRFVEENQLDWCNASYGKGEPNYDLIDYFDILTTPGIYLISKDHIMISAQFPIETLEQQLIKNIR